MMDRYMSGLRESVYGVVKRMAVLGGQQRVSIPFFILPLCLLVICFQGVAVASSIQIGAQVTDTDALTGTLSGRFDRIFEEVDLYILAYPSRQDAGAGDPSLFYLHSAVTGDGGEDDRAGICRETESALQWQWRSGVMPIGHYVRIDPGKWGTLSCVDFSIFKGALSDLTLLMLLVKAGEYPYDPASWVDLAISTLITDPLARVPGQTAFVSGGDTYRDNLTPIDAEPDVAPVPGDDADSDDKEDVEKPDIYKIDGSRLYYANGSANRFQVIDISRPDQPEIRYSQRLDGIPRDLYLLDGYVILLLQESNSNQTSVTLKVYHDAGDTIEPVANESYLDLNYLNSRRSGNRIFITATTADSIYYPEAPMVDAVMPYPEENTVVMAVDIENPQRPQWLGQKALTGYDADIYLDSSYMVQIVRESWQSTILYIFDLTLDEGLFSQYTAIDIPGRIPSEYHVKVSDETLFVIYRDEDLEKGSTLKIYDIVAADRKERGIPDMDMDMDMEMNVGRDRGMNVDRDVGVDGRSNGQKAVERGKVEGIAPGEELYAATFMEDRAYIVTYERTDPLWVVDLSNPDAPTIVGELEVPGWSEYIRFHNDRLIALGYDDSDGKRRVSVAIFSVEDPTRPELLDRVTPLTGEADYTSSVAISDDRGFYFNTASGLILLPIQYYGSESVSGLEIVQIASDYNRFQWDHFVPAGFYVQRGSEAGEISADVTGPDSNDDPVSGHNPDNSDDLDSTGDIIAADQTILLSMGDAALQTIDITGVSSSQKPEIEGTLRLSYNVEKIALINGETTLLGVGGDYYQSSSSDLMRFDMTTTSETAQSLMDVPEEITDTELSYPELLIDRGAGSADGGIDGDFMPDSGVLFSWNGSAFRCFDPDTMALGKPVRLDSVDHWMRSDPIYRDHRLYYAISEYGPIPMIDDASEKGKEDGKEDPYATSTTLKGFDCSDFNAPRKLSDLSIPGIPVALLDDNLLVTVEQLDYYYPYYPPYEDGVPVKADTEPSGSLDAINVEINGKIDDVDVDSSSSGETTPDDVTSDDMPPENPLPPEPALQGLRVNLLDLSDDGAVLDATAFFHRDEIGYAQVICEQSRIFLISWQDDETEIRLLDLESLSVDTTYRVDGRWSPIEVSHGKMVLMKSMVYPYYYDTYIPYWNQNELLVLEFSDGDMTTRLKDAMDYYPTKQTLEIGEDSIYIANGYQGIVRLPLD